MSKVKVALTGFSRGFKPGDVVSVEKDVAETLIRERHAEPVTEAGKQLEAEVRAS